MELMKRTWAEISLENLKHNVKSLMSALPEGCIYLGVVKADAYGHGAVEAAKALEQAGAGYLAVACLDEALELREAGVKLPILVLGYTSPKFTRELIEGNITQAVGSAEAALRHSDEAVAAGGVFKIHIKADTGMSRTGFMCAGESFQKGISEISRAVCLPGLEAEGIFTHFAVSDEEDEESRKYTLVQFDTFMALISAVEKNWGKDFVIRHCANSGAVINYPQMALDMVRPGIAMYGYCDPHRRFGLKPCMRLVTRVMSINTYPAGTTISYGRTYTAEKEMRVGVIGVGYADGIFRCTSNKFEVFSRGRRLRQIGRVCMDMCMIDLSDAPEVKVGDEVEIFGENVDLEELARIAGTIPYEMLTCISPRVHRVYK